MSDSHCIDQKDAVHALVLQILVNAATINKRTINIELH